MFSMRRAVTSGRDSVNVMLSVSAYLGRAFGETMKHFAQKLTSILAVAGLSLAPIAAQANTRAGDSSATYSSALSQPGQGRSVEGENASGAGNIIAMALLGLWASGIIIVAADINFGGDDDNQSPGAN